MGKNRLWFHVGSVSFPLTFVFHGLCYYNHQKEADIGMPTCMLSSFSRVWLFATSWTVSLEAPLSMGFSRQEYQSGLPCPPPGDLPDPGIELMSLLSLHWQVGSLPLVPSGKLNWFYVCCFISCNFTDFIYSKSSLVESLEFPINKVMSLENRYNFTSFFLIWMLFISFPV